MVPRILLLLVAASLPTATAIAKNTSTPTLSPLPPLSTSIDRTARRINSLQQKREICLRKLHQSTQCLS